MRYYYGINEVKELSDYLKSQRFKKKKNAYYRIVGDGVLQIIMYDYNLNRNIRELSVGIQSMYSPLWNYLSSYPDSFANYPIPLFAGKRDYTEVITSGKRESLITMSHHEQLELLRNVVVSALDLVKTQRELLDIMNELDRIDQGSIRWNNIARYSPYLFIGEYKYAERVIASILSQHRMARIRKKQWSEENNIPLLLEDNPIEDIELSQLLEMAITHNTQTIEEYLNTNCSRNQAIMGCVQDFL